MTLKCIKAGVPGEVVRFKHHNVTGFREITAYELMHLGYDIPVCDIADMHLQVFLRDGETATYNMKHYPGSILICEPSESYYTSK